MLFLFLLLLLWSSSSSSPASSLYYFHHHLHRRRRNLWHLQLYHHHHHRHHHNHHHHHHHHHLRYFNQNQIIIISIQTFFKSRGMALCGVGSPLTNLLLILNGTETEQDISQRKGNTLGFSYVSVCDGIVCYVMYVMSGQYPE